MNAAVGLRLTAGSTPMIGSPRGPGGSLRTAWAAPLIRGDDYSPETATRWAATAIRTVQKAIGLPRRDPSQCRRTGVGLSARRLAPSGARWTRHGRDRRTLLERS